MFYKELIVEIPKKKRIRKGKTDYVYEILERKGVNYEKDKVVCVGIYIGENKMHPNEKYFQLHEEKIDQQPLNEPPLFSTQLSVGATLIIDTILKNEGVSKKLELSFPGYSKLIQSIISYYLVERDSVAQLYNFFCNETFVNLNYIASESTISNLFNKKINTENIKVFLEDWLKYRLDKHGNNATINVDFDSTSFNTSSSNIDSAEYGYSKSNESIPQVNVAYFLDRKTGVPIYYDIYYGSIIDMEHCITATSKIKQISETSKISFVMDRGYFSSKNLAYFQDNQFSFLCMGKDTTCFKNLINQNPKHVISKSINRIHETTFGLKFNSKLFDKEKQNYFIYLYYDEEKVPYLCSEKYKYAENISKNLAGKKDKNNHILNTYKDVVFIEKDENDIIVSCKINYDYLDSYSDKCGYFYIVSNEDLELDDVLKSYRHRDIVEKQFKYAKTGCCLEKTYAQSDMAFNSKTFIGFLCGVVRASMIITLKPLFLQYSNETTQTVLMELQKIKAEKISDKYLLKYSLTSKQKQVLSLFGLTLKDVTEYIKKINETIAEM